MLQLNDIEHTLIDLTKENLRHIKYNNNYYVKVVFDLKDCEVETSFIYETGAKARKDYQMLLDLVQDGPTLLQEEDMEKYSKLNLNRWDENKT